MVASVSPEALRRAKTAHGEPMREEDTRPRKGLARRALEWLKGLPRRVPGAAVFLQAFINYVRHESANQAGHVAFSVVLAMFPFVLFLSKAASLLGEPGAAAELTKTLLDYAPPAVAQALAPVIDEVLGEPSRTLLTVGFLGTLWAASSGAQAIRIALNRAYGVKQGLSFWKARLKVLVFTFLGTIATVLAFSSVVVLPYIATALDRVVDEPVLQGWLWLFARYGVAFVVLVVLYAICYHWLPDLPQRWRTVLPGALAGPVLWLMAAALLSWTLRGVGKLTPVYGSFAGTIATLIFLYVSAVTLIFGAEINGVLRGERAGTGKET